MNNKHEYSKCKTEFGYIRFQVPKQKLPRESDFRKLKHSSIKHSFVKRQHTTKIAYDFLFRSRIFNAKFVIQIFFKLKYYQRILVFEYQNLFVLLRNGFYRIKFILLYFPSYNECRCCNHKLVTAY